MDLRLEVGDGGGQGEIKYSIFSRKKQSIANCDFPERVFFVYPLDEIFLKTPLKNLLKTS